MVEAFPHQTASGQHDAGCISWQRFQRGQGGAALRQLCRHRDQSGSADLLPSGVSAPGSADRLAAPWADGCGSPASGSGALRQAAGRCGEWGRTAGTGSAADRAGQVAVDRCIAEGQQLAVVAVAAGDPWLLADAWAPRIGAGRCIARALVAVALPAQGLDVVTTAEQAPEQRHLLLRGTGAVGLQKPNQAGVLPAQLVQVGGAGVSHGMRSLRRNQCPAPPAALAPAPPVRLR
jgi:hypothetical protein